MKRSRIVAFGSVVAVAGLVVLGASGLVGGAVEPDATSVESAPVTQAETSTQAAFFVDSLVADPVAILDSDGKATLDMGGGITFEVATTVANGVIASVDSFWASAQPNGSEIVSSETNIMDSGSEAQVVAYVKVPGTGTVCLTGMVEL